MNKFLVITVLALFLALPVVAATNDFVADADITVPSVIGDVTADMIIMNGSSAASWSFTSASALTVTDPGTFKVRSDNATVKSFLVKSGSNTVACALNTTPGASYYVTLPTASGTYTVVPSTTASCSALCTTVTGADTYYQSNGTYTVPSCGVATCTSPYSLSTASPSITASCSPAAIASSSGTSSGGGGGGGSQSVACSTVAFDDWQTSCVNSLQYRNVKSSSPSGCYLTTAQDNDRKRQCTSPATPATPAAPGETPATPATPASAADQIKNIVAEAATIAGHIPADIAAAVGAMQSAKTEDAAEVKYTNNLVAGLKNITAAVKDAITYFVVYGTPTTKILGAGERAGVINSYKSAFSKVPATAAEWADVIKIGNGRWPTARSATAEARATVEFKKVYKRSPDMQQANDNAAVTVIAYGLRPANRNMNSEKAAIKSFKAIYGHNPVTAIAWDIVRAIAYSGAKR